jgi:hypothetical protein
MSWNKIDNLLKKIEEFNKRALWSELVIKAQHDVNHAKKETPEQKADREADEWMRKNPLGNKGKINAPKTITPELKKEVTGIYPEIISFIKDVKNQSVSEQLIKIAELYKETIQNNQDPSLLYDMINNFLETTLVDNYSDYDYEDDIEPGTDAKDITPEQAAKLEGQNIEILLREVYADIGRRDFTKTKPTTSEPTTTEAPTPEPTEEKEDDSEGGGDDYERPGYGTGVDPKELGGKKTRDDGGKPSMGAITIREPKDWAASYAAEKERSLDQLNDPSIDSTIKKGINERIQLLDKLIENTLEEAAMLKDAGISWVIIPKTDTSPRRRVPEQPDQRSKYDAIKEEQKRLRTLNNIIKTKIRQHTILHSNQKIDEEISQTRSPKLKFLLEEQKKLNELITKRDYNKSPEIKARRKFIKFIEGGIPPEKLKYDPERTLPNLNKEMVDRFTKEIEEASKLKIPLTEYRKSIDVRKEKRESEEFDGLVFKFGQQIDTIVSDNITKAVKIPLQKRLAAEGYNNPFFIPYIKAVADSKASFDASPSPDNKKRLDHAQKIMMQAAEEWVDNNPIVAEINNKYAGLKEVKSELKALTGKTGGRGGGKKTNEWLYGESIPEEGKAILRQLNDKIKKVIADFKFVHKTAMQQLSIISDTINKIIT